MTKLAVCFDLLALKKASDAKMDYAICPGLSVDESEKYTCKVLPVHSGDLQDEQLLATYMEAFVGREPVITATVNDSYKFIVVPLVEVVNAIDLIETADAVTIAELYLYDGSDRAPVMSVVMADNIESSKRIFTSRSVVINPLLKQWADAKGVGVVWEMESRFSLKFKFFLRCVILWLATFVATIRGLRFGSNEHDGPSLAVYRKPVQAFSLYDYLEANDLESVRVFGVPVAAAASGGRFLNVLSIKNLVRSVCYSLKGIVTVLCSKPSEDLSFVSGGVFYSVSERATLIEGLCLLDQLMYMFFIREQFSSGEVVDYYSTEMTSRFAVLERELCRQHGVRSICVQCGLLSGLKVPYFPLHDTFVCISEPEMSALSALYGGGTFVYEGPIRKTPTQVALSCDVLLLSQPYAQEEVQRVVTLLSTNFPHLKCTFRVHPRDTYKYTLGDNFQLDDQADCWASVLAARVVVGMTTTVLEDAVNAGKQSVSFQFDEYSRGVASSYSVGAGAVCYDLRSLKSCFANMKFANE